MNEYSRILIEQYCMEHNSRKSRRLARLVKTGLSETNSYFYANLYEENFSELRLNTILNMLQRNREQMKQLELFLVEK